MFQGLLTVEEINTSVLQVKTDLWCDLYKSTQK